MGKAEQVGWFDQGNGNNEEMNWPTQKWVESDVHPLFTKSPKNSSYQQTTA